MKEDPSGRERLLRLASRLAARTAHELNNVSAVLTGHLYLLRSSNDPPEESYEAMEKALAHLQRVSGSLARLGPLGTGEAGSFDLNGAVRSAVEESGLGVALELEEGVWPVHGRESDVRLALAALLDNAREANGEGGGIRVFTRSDPIGSGILLGVEDSGPGGAPELRGRAFDPLFSTKGERGRGIGLTLVACVAAAHGAECEIESCEGGGTRVSIRFPAGR